MFNSYVKLPEGRLKNCHSEYEMYCTVSSRAFWDILGILDAIVLGLFKVMFFILSMENPPFCGIYSEYL